MDNKEDLTKSFGENAHSYKISNVFSDKEDLDRMINIVGPIESDIALDIATGAGHTAVKLSRHVKEVVAIDVVENMLNQAKLLIKENKIENINLMNMDVHSLEFKDDYFDIATCRFAPHHFYNIEVAIKEVYRVLKKGGKLYVLDCSVLNLEEAKATINNIEKLRDPSHVNSYSLEEWQDILKNVGFEVLYAKNLKRQYILPDWFDRMNTPAKNRDKIFNILRGMSENLKQLYSFDERYMTTYYVELLAVK
ncbi:MAG: class I SAM-dependent methyltransferase [Hydrogenobaculum sp.]